MKLKFEPSDFTDQDIPCFSTPRKAADMANAKLDAWLAQAAVVYNHHTNNAWLASASGSTDENVMKFSHTHRALLINIEPIEKKECEHEKVAIVTESVMFKGTKPVYKCINCQEYVKPVWTITECKIETADE